jgi:hypothetical protein
MQYRGRLLGRRDNLSANSARCRDRSSRELWCTTGRVRLSGTLRALRIGDAYHGTHVFPDANALFQGENAQPLYTVKYLARTLWGEVAKPKDTVCLDLWEDYLDPA